MQTWNKEIRVEPIASRTPSGSRHTAIENTFVIQGLIQDAIFAYCKDQRYRLESVRCKESTDQTRLTAVSYFSLKLVEQHEGVTLKNRSERQARQFLKTIFTGVRSPLPLPYFLLRSPFRAIFHYLNAGNRLDSCYLRSNSPQTLLHVLFKDNFFFQGLCFYTISIKLLVLNIFGVIQFNV